MNNKIPQNNKDLLKEIESSQQKKCPNCNVDIPANNNFCTKCGFRFNNPSTNNNGPKKKKSSTGIIIALVIVGLVIGFFWLIWPSIQHSIDQQWKKPIIYIYPEKDMDITIKLGSDDLLTHTYPKYDNEWNEHVDTTGNIYDYKTNRNYYALYWEGKDNTKLDMSEGFVVKGEDTTKFLEEKLEQLGLNEKEIEEFIIYWLPKLEDNKYNFIRFRTNDEINNYMPIEFSEEPDTLIRVMVDFKPLDKKIKVKEQKLEETERKGFTIVEWGARLN